LSDDLSLTQKNLRKLTCVW